MNSLLMQLALAALGQFGGNGPMPMGAVPMAAVPMGDFPSELFLREGDVPSCPCPGR